MSNAYGTGCVTKRKDGSFQYSKWVKLPDETRKRVTKYSVRSGAEARRKAEAAIADLEKAIIKKMNEGKLLRSWVKTYLDNYIQNHKRPHTYESYRSMLDNHLVPVFGEKMLDEITSMELQKHFTDLLKDGLSPRTVHTVRRYTSMLFNQALRSGLVNKNPVKDTTPPRLERKNHPVLTADEAKKFIALSAEAKEPYYAHMLPVLYSLAIKTGMRKGEIFGLLWSDINFFQKCINVSHNLINPQKGQPFIGEPKTRTSFRKIGIDETDIAMLKEWREYLEQHKEKMGDNYLGADYDVVFPSLQGTLTRFSNFDRRFFIPMRKAMKLSDDFKFHTLRHTCATLLLTNQLNPKIIQERLGHASVQITLDIYTQYLPCMQDEAVAAMQKIL